ncbi:MAG: M28 family peptidase [Flavobacteriaceae bacterium]|nr:M28 family peptidase [Flavobacteriaceae bacterium]
MKLLLYSIITTLIFSCSTKHLHDSKSKPTLIETSSNKVFASSITITDLKNHLNKIASDEFEGRKTGTEGQKKAANYIRDFYSTNNILSPLSNGTYFQPIPKDFFRGRSDDDSENVLAFIEGTDKKEEIIVISAHYDHLGVRGRKIYNGADDDGSGTVAIMEIAQAFKIAVSKGKGPRRSLLFLHVTGEEIGLFGSKYYVQNPIFPLKNTVTNLNIDMIGRVDDAHKTTPNFVYVIGSGKLSKELKSVSEYVNKKYTHLSLDYKFDAPEDPNRFYYRSDHYNFAKNGIPIIFYFNGTHKDYHRESDTVDKINFEVLEKRTKLIFFTAWELANRENRVKVD